jgi:hypothetical protein
MALTHSPRIITDGLVLCLDAGNPKSYPGSGTTWTDLSGRGNNGTLNGATYSGSNGGNISFDGTDDYATVSAFTYTPYCLDFWVYNKTQITANDGSMGGPGAQPYQTLFRNLTDVQLNLGGWTGAATNETLHIFSGSKYTYINQTIPIGFHNWVYNWNGSNYDIWVDGVKKNAIAGSTGHASLTQQSSTNYIAYRQSSEYYFYGNIYCIKIYGSQITDSQVSQNFNALRGRYGI